MKMKMLIIINTSDKKIKILLNHDTKEPLGVSLAAGRYAAMKLYLMHGRAETMAFFDNCIQTVEIAEDPAVTPFNPDDVISINPVGRPSLPTRGQTQLRKARPTSIRKCDIRDIRTVLLGFADHR